MDKVGEVLAELREEQARLALELRRVERVIDALEQAAGLAAQRESTLVQATPVASERPAPAPAPYAQLDLYEATALYLSTVDEPQTSSQIAQALQAGGFKTRSIRFTSTVRTMLRRRSSPGIRATSDGKRWYAKKVR